MSKIPAATKAISIPFRIKRSPTDLLKALSKTVNLDPTGPQYSLIDDTFLGRTNPFDIRKAHLAKASGIRTARFMIEKYPEAFMKDDCDPHVSKFFPSKQFTEKELKYPSESLIFSLMSWGKLKQAFDTLQKCKDENIMVSEECKLALLDLMCIHNSDDLKPRPFPLEAYYMRGLRKEIDSRGRPILANTWKKNSEAEVLFNELKSKNAEAYCSVIKGMFKYNEFEGGKKLFEEMKSHQLVPDLHVLNLMIEQITYDSESRNDQKVEMMLQRLRDIRDYGHTPNLRTFNTCLEVIASLGMFQRAIPLSLDVFKEMEIVGVKPSLATYASILEIFYPNRDIGSNTGILDQVIDEVEKMANASPNGLEWRDINDANFFTTAMTKCNSGIMTQIDTRLLGLTNRIHSLVMKDHNYRFMNNSNLHTRYFEAYLNALMKFDTSENVIKEWRYLTPNIFNRTLINFEQLFNYVRDNGCYEFLLELWSNLPSRTFTERRSAFISLLDFRANRFTDFMSRCMNLILTTISEYPGDDKDLLAKYADVTQHMIEKFPYVAEKPLDDEEETRILREYNWSAQMLSRFFDIQLKTKRYNAVWNEFLRYQQNQQKVPGEIKEDLVFRMIVGFLEAHQSERALEVVKFAVSANLPLSVELLQKIEDGSNLDSKNKSLLKQLKDKYNV